MSKITPFLWFDGKAEEAATFYVSIFKNSSITRVVRSSIDTPGGPAGSVLTVAFELDGNLFVGLNGGPHHVFNPSISFAVDCATQEDVDYFWAKLSDGGKEVGCGWVTDRYGVSWQVVPTMVSRLLSGPDAVGAKRAMAALMDMKKLDIQKLQDAYNNR